MRSPLIPLHRFAAAAACFFVLGAACAAEPSLDDLAFLAGFWGGTADGVESEELWTAPKAGLMLGIHRDVMASGRAAFEYLRIEVDEEGVVYRASPQGRSATSFRLVETSAGRAVFSNPEHDFPRRIVYWLENGQLCARVEGDVRGEPRVLQWRWDPRPLPEPAADAPRPSRPSTPR